MKKTLLTTALFLGTVSVASAAPIIIDNFNGSTFTSNAPIAIAAAGTGSSGYTRTATATTSGPNTNIQINTSSNTGVYAHSQDSGVTGYSQINYNLGGIDLDEEANAFRIQLNSIDLGGFFGVIVDSISYQLSSTAVIISNGGTLPSYADILFSSFSGVNWNSVNTVSLFVNGNSTPALDASLDNFGTVCSAATASGGVGTNPAAGNCTPPTTNVPEPAMLGLMGLGLAAMGATRRRRQA